MILCNVFILASFFSTFLLATDVSEEDIGFRFPEYNLSDKYEWPSFRNHVILYNISKTQVQNEFKKLSYKDAAIFKAHVAKFGEAVIRKEFFNSVEEYVNAVIKYNKFQQLRSGLDAIYSTVSSAFFHKFYIEHHFSESPLCQEEYAKLKMILGSANLAENKLEIVMAMIEYLADYFHFNEKADYETNVARFKNVFWDSANDVVSIIDKLGAILYDKKPYKLTIDQLIADEFKDQLSLDDTGHNYFLSNIKYAFEKAIIDFPNTDNVIKILKKCFSSEEIINSVLKTTEEFLTKHKNVIKEAHDDAKTIQDNTKTVQDNTKISRDDLTTTQDDLTIVQDNTKISRDDAKTTRDDVTTVQNDVEKFQDDLTTTRDDAKTVQDNMKISQDNVTTTQDNTKTIQDDLTTTRDNDKKFQDSTKTVQDNTKISQDNVTTSQDDAKTTRDNTKTVQNDVEKFQDDLTITQDDVTTTQDNTKITQDDLTSQDNMKTVQDGAKEAQNQSNQYFNTKNFVIGTVVVLLIGGVIFALIFKKRLSKKQTMNLS